MIELLKSQSANTIVTTFTEKLDAYSLSGASGQTFYFKLENDTTKDIISFSATDISTSYTRYNEFIIDETALNLKTGLYTYYAYPESQMINLLEIGRLVVNGTNTNNDIYL